MDTLDRIFSLMRANNIEQQELAKALGINKTIISEWKSGKSKSYLKHLEKIALFFSVSVDHLLGIEKPATPDEEQPVSEEAQKLAERIMNLSPNKIAKVLDYLDLLEK